MDSSKRKPQTAVVWLERDDLRAPDCPFLPGVEPHPQMPQDGSDSADYLIGDWWRPTQSRPLHATRCISIARSTGRRCRRWSTFGQARCPKHSGYGLLRNSVEYRARVLERAAEDLCGAASYTVENVVDLVTGADVAPPAQLKACLDLLARVGSAEGTHRGAEHPRQADREATDLIRERLDDVATRPAGERV